MIRSPYVRSFAVAVFTGTVSALAQYFTLLPQPGLSWQQLVSQVGMAFIAPFAVLAHSLPKWFTDGQPPTS